LKGSRIQGFEGSSDVVKSYKEQNVWQKSYDLCLKIYKITKRFPNGERYGLTSQIRRAGEESQFLSSFQNLGAALDEELYRAVQAPMHLK